MKTTNILACLLASLCLAHVSQAQITIVGGTPTLGFLGSNKTQVTTTHNGATQVNFDATGADKLVVVYAAESGFNNNTVTSLSMSFNGVPMTLARFQQELPNPILNDNGAVAIFYLDDPFQGAANFTAGYSATAGGANGGFVSIFGLTGTADGIGAVAGTSHVDVVNGNNVGTSITTTAANSLVIAGIQVSGSNNVSGSIPTAVSPLTIGNNASWGSNWGHGASGSQAVAGVGTTITPTFVSGTSRYVDVAAVEFTMPVPTQYWDRNDTTAGAGNPADGTWDASATNWNPLADGTGTVAAWPTGQKAVFAAGTDATDPYTVTVDGTQGISGITFENGTPTLANGTSGALSLTDISPFNVTPTITATVATPVTEDSAGRQLIKVGEGTLALSGNNTYTGATTVAQGTLILSGNNASATGGMMLNAGFTQFNSPASINGTGENVTLNAGATLLFGGAFGAGNIPAALDRIVTTSAGVIAADNYDATNLDFNTPALSAAFLGAVGDVAYTGTLTPEGSTYRLGGGGGMLTMSNTNAVTGSGKALIVNGKVTLAGANNHDGGTTITSGLLALGNDGALGSGGLFISGGQISSDSTTARSLANATTLNTGGIVLGDAVNNGKLTFASSVDLGGATRSLALSSDVEFSNVVSNGGLTKLGDGTLTLSGNNTYTGPTTLSGGTMVLSGTSTTSGVAANAGTLVIGNADALGAGTLGLALVNVESVGTVVTTNPVSWTNTVTITGTGELTLGVMTPNGNRTLTNNNTTSTTTIAGITSPGQNRNLVFAGAGNTTVTGDITTGTGTLTKNNAGVLTLNGANTYTGATAVNGGVLRLNSAGALPGGIGATGGTGALTFNGGVLGLANGDFQRPSGTATTVGAFFMTGNGGWAAYGADRNVTIGGDAGQVAWGSGVGVYSWNGKMVILGHSTATHKVTVTNPIDTGAAVRPIQVDDGAAAVDGELSGVITSTSAAGGITKSGNGTLLLSNNNTYTGNTVVTAGTLTLGVDNCLNNASDVLIGNGILGLAAGVNDTAGTLDVTDTTATINLGTGATMAFADSSAVDWTGGELDITGNFVTGVSIRFGTTAGGLTPTQLDLITVNGSGTYTLDSSGFLIQATTGTPYQTWSGGAPYDGDANGDGVENGVAFLLGAVGPNVSALDKLPVVTQSGGDLVLTFSMLNAASRGSASLRIQHSGDLGITDPWASALVPESSGTVSGVTFTVTPAGSMNNVVATIPSSGNAIGGKLFGRLRANE